MKLNINATPAGTRDIMLGRCVRRRELEAALSGVYKKRGYDEVITPSLEYCDVFTACENPLTQESMYKLTESGGRLLVIRPDCTVPIGRVCATRLKNAPLPLRLCYNLNVFRAGGSLDGKRSEITQSGIELIGAQGLRADVEITATAIEALKACGTNFFKLEIGHVGIYKALCGGLSFKNGDGELIQDFIESKNYAALSDALSDYENEYPEACRALRRMPRLFGGADVLDEAESCISDPEALRSLSYLRDVYDALCGLGLGEHVLVDLGLVHHISYYTGVVFRGYVDGFGATALSGGRYDGLLDSYDANLPAVGFACDVDALADSLGDSLCEVPDVMIHYDEGFAESAYREAERIMDGGGICEMSVFETPDEARGCAAKKGIKKLIIAGAAGLQEEVCV